MMTSQHKAMATTPKRSTYKHAFVDTLPDQLDEGVLYVCVQYKTSAHNCFCGCAREVVTPLHPTKWKMTFDGDNVSLFPSIGSWSLACKSHYWIQGGRVAWAESWSNDLIEAARSRDIADQDRYFGQAGAPSISVKADARKPASLWRRVVNWFEGN